METLPIRLPPGEDLRRALEAAVAGHGHAAAFVLCGIGSLSSAHLRFAGMEEAQVFGGDLEVLSLGGSIARNGAHLHAALATSSGSVIGGHVAYGCIVRTTAEVLVGLLNEWEFRREPDPATGYQELTIRARRAEAGG